MARPRTPTNVLELRGAFKKDPQRKRPKEPDVVEGIGDPPELPDGALKCWHEVVSLAHAGTLSRSDRVVVEHLARILAILRAENWESNPALMIRLERCLAALGMTPADRSRVSALKSKPDADPYAEFKQA